MPMWRCPHCGTPQAETARCWVCRRSSTACATCQHFRRSVAGQLGYCGLDRQRRPLQGDEIRACWEATIAPIETPVTGFQRPTLAPLNVVEDRTPVRRLEFVEVRSTPAASRRRGGPGVGSGAKAGVAAGSGAAATAAQFEDETQVVASPPESRWSLWGDPES